MRKHYGQHPSCAKCDDYSLRNTMDAVDLRIFRSKHADEARSLALADGLSRRIADRAGSYAADGTLTPEEAVSRAVEEE